MSTIRVTYRLTCPATEAAAMARDLALEQSVEVPERVVELAGLPRGIVGEVTAITPVLPAESPGAAGPERHDAVVEYAAHLAADQLPQLLNLLYGNISIKNKIRIVDLRLPEEWLARFGGPRYGVAGLRRQLGVYERPLLATAIKPRGATLEHLVGVARDFALGGGDLVKDDHNLVDSTYETFAERVTRTQQAVQDANQRTGRNTLYYPTLMPRFGELDRQLDLLERLGVPGVLLCPFILGPDLMRHLRDTRSLALMAHPALAGTFFHDPDHGIEPALLLGTLTRIAGADASVFPNHGGRFAFSVAQCGELGAALRQPLGDLAPAWPAPAGGMRLDSIPAMAELYGPDAIFLIGGALLSHSDDLIAATRAFAERINERFTARIASPEPAGSFTSACELPAPPAGHVQTLLKFAQDFTWSGRSRTTYKDSGELPFEGVARCELIGRAGEQTAFDVRYFELAPGGYTSRERHQHTHTVIAVRGCGMLEVGGDTVRLDHLDIGYVPPGVVHQLRNAGAEPFGFLCIVDHERDRPQAP